MANESDNKPLITIPSPTQTIYQDKMLEIATGPAVTRMVFGLEVGLNTFSPSISLVMPTVNFVESVEFLYNLIKTDPSFKKNVLLGMSEMKEKIEKL